MKTTLSSITASVKEQQYRQEIDRLKREMAEQNAAFQKQTLELKEELASARSLAKFYYNFINQIERK